MGNLCVSQRCVNLSQLWSCLSGRREEENKSDHRRNFGWRKTRGKLRPRANRQNAPFQLFAACERDTTTEAASYKGSTLQDKEKMEQPKPADDPSESESQYDSTTDESKEEKEPAKAGPAIGAKENKRVIYSRLLVAIVLAVCAALTAALTYSNTKQEEQNQFESQVSVAARIRPLHSFYVSC